MRRRRRKKTFEKPAFRIKKKESEKIYYLSTDPLQQNQKKMKTIKSSCAIFKSLFLSNNNLRSSKNH
jgi:hypothetical protein